MLSFGIMSEGMLASFLVHAEKLMMSKHPKNKNECLWLNKDCFSMSFSTFVLYKSNDNEYF